MSARTADELQDNIDAALAWRRIELNAMRALVENYEKAGRNLPADRSLRRAGVAMLYAHWEGFAKESFQWYIDFVTRRRLMLTELNDGLLHSALAHTFRRAESGDLAAGKDLVEVVRRRGEIRVQLPKSQIANTKSNLRFEVLLGILESFGLDAAIFELRENLIDRRLCDTRNSVAHGRDTCPAIGEFSELLAEVVPMMESLRDLILGAARSGAYRAAAT